MAIEDAPPLSSSSALCLLDIELVGVPEPFCDCNKRTEWHLRSESGYKSGKGYDNDGKKKIAVRQ